MLDGGMYLIVFVGVGIVPPNFGLFLIHIFILRVMGCGAAEVTGLVFFVLLLSTYVCCQPTELILGFFLFHKFANFTPPRFPQLESPLSYPQFNGFAPLEETLKWTHSSTDYPGIGGLTRTQGD